MSGCICLDASILLKILLPEEGSEAAERLLETAIGSGAEIVMPSFSWVEVGSVLRQKVKRGEISPPEAEEAWQIFQNMKAIEYVDNAEVRDLAWKIAAENNLPTLYDAAYLAVAEIVSKKSKISECEFWTADKKLYHAVKAKKGYIKLLPSGTSTPRKEP